jgi:hypothetical protein
MLDVLRIIRPGGGIVSVFVVTGRWKSPSAGGRPQIDADQRALIRRMSVDNPCGALHVSTASRSLPQRQQSLAQTRQTGSRFAAYNQASPAAASSNTGSRTRSITQQL